MEYVGWLVAVLVLVGVELLSLDLILLMLAGGALAGAVVAIADGPFLLQVVVAAAVALLLLGFVRPVALRHLRTPHSHTNVDRLIGLPAVVVEEVAAHGGRVKVHGEIWSARSDGPTNVYVTGQTVHVVRIDGATAVVAA